MTSGGVICADCRDLAAVRRLLGGRKVNLVITSPPYAALRVYDETVFQPIAPDQYVTWYRDVASVIHDILADDGSYLLNIKEHAQDGERHLYVKDLVLAHKREWGWRFVDEFCWRKTDNGVPGGWDNRFKNAWEPVFHFTKQNRIKFRPLAVGHTSADCFDYSASNPKSVSGSGLLGSGPRGAAAEETENGRSRRRLSHSDGSRRGLQSENSARGDAMRRTRESDDQGRFEGIARPSNVIDARTECSQGDHSAPFPVALPEFFIKAFTDPGDVVYDPFLGSGTTMVAALRLGRAGFGCELSAAYCDVIVQRAQRALAENFVLDGDGRTFAEVGQERVQRAA